MPESAPGPNSISFSAGHSARTCFHVLMRPCAAGSHIFFRSATVIALPLTQLLFGLMTTVSASNATGNSMYLMPVLRQASISSVGIGRDAFDMSVSPRQNFLKPPPVPDMPTVTRTLPRLEIWNSSANASETGNTVLEPSILIAAWASALCGAPAATTPTNSAGTKTFCHNFMDLTLYR